MTNVGGAQLRWTLLPSREEVEVLQGHRYLGIHMDNRLDWKCNTKAVYRMGQSRLYFLRKLRSINDDL